MFFFKRFGGVGVGKVTLYTITAYDTVTKKNRGPLKKTERKKMKQTNASCAKA